jgi:hypothetical protein
MLFVLLLAAPALPGAQTADQAKKVETDASQHFNKGKELIENNCIDCMDGTQAGMEQGIKEVKAALQAGYRDRKAAYELLSDAYAHMGTYAGKHPEEEKVYITKRQEIDRKLFELYPEDPDVLQRYESTLDYKPENDAERMKILKRLVKIKPTPDSKFGLGMLLMQQRNINEGLPLVRSAITTEDNPEAVMNYVERLVGRLGELGCPLANTASWNEKAYAAFDKATRGSGDPRALPEFKKDFSAALDQIGCTVKLR